MKLVGSLFIGAALFQLALVQAAAAGTLDSPLLFAVGTDEVACNVVNVGTTQIASVTLDLFDDSGTTVSNPGTTTCTGVNPGSGCFVTSVNPLNGYARCHILVTGGKVGKVRAAVVVRDNSGNEKVVVPFPK